MTITSGWGTIYCSTWWGDNDNKQTIQDVIDAVCS